jgi:putative (di)nucleoside polyphosphate hydrolase
MALRFAGSDADINIATPEPEFCEWRWLPAADLINLALPFKRGVYERILAEFGDLT